MSCLPFQGCARRVKRSGLGPLPSSRPPHARGHRCCKGREEGHSHEDLEVAEGQVPPARRPFLASRGRAREVEQYGAKVYSAPGRQGPGAREPAVQ